jgi:hypothetical protein
MAGKVLKGVAGLNKMLNDLPKEVQARIRDESVAIAADVATEARGRALSGGVAKVAKYVAPTIRATRDRAPVVRMGGSGKLPPRNGVFRSATVGDVMWGAEFGSARHKQFMPWGGNSDSAGYFLWPSIRLDEAVERWADAVEDAMKAAY